MTEEPKVADLFVFPKFRPEDAGRPDVSSFPAHCGHDVRINEEQRKQMGDMWRSERDYLSMCTDCYDDW
jgi:hypothetical protein